MVVEVQSVFNPRFPHCNLSVSMLEQDADPEL